MPTMHNQTLLGTIAIWWHNWRNCRAAAAEIEALPGEELSRVAQDVGLGVPQLRTLAGKWPDSADLLSQRLEALRIDEVAVARTEPGVLRDMQRVCTQCAEKAHCGHDIDRDSSDLEWRTYCPNVETLDALEAERATRRLAHKHGA